MTAHPTFAPDQRSEALEFFIDQNYVVVSNALPAENVEVLTAFVDRSERETAREWGPGCRSHAQILSGSVERCHGRQPLRLAR